MQQGYAGGVVAPAVMPKQAGARVHTDRRDDRPLARFRRSGDLTPVDVPTVADEAIRALSRAREATRRALKAAKVRLNAFVLRHDIRSTGRAHGSPAPLRWLSAVVCPTPAPPSVWQEQVQTVTEPTDRLQRLAQALHAQGPTWRFQPVVEALQARRGGQFTVAVTMVAKRGDLTRFEKPRQRMHNLGLTPADSCRGTRRQPGRMTKTGHPQACRALVEGAWAYRYPANVSRHLQRRLAQLPQAVQTLSWKAPVRLCPRSRQLQAQGNQANQVVVARARALRAFMWAMAQQVTVPPTAYRRCLGTATAVQRSNVHRQRRSPGMVSPSAA